MRNDDSSTCPIKDDGQQHSCINCLGECDENDEALDHYHSVDSRHFLIFQEKLYIREQVLNLPLPFFA